MFRPKPLNAAISLAVGAALTTGVLATQVAFAADDDVMEEVVVTGSRIKRTDLVGDNPVTVLDRDYLTNLGTMSIGDVLQDIPNSAGGAVNTGVNNGGSGATRFSLRGLGSQATLVLLNGHRVVASGLGANSSVDLNNIPVSMIERVEVLKDGASAIYGSDAIAGVVNIITRHNFAGVDFNAYMGQTSENDGEVDAVDITVGVDGDNGNAVFSAFYVNQKPIWAGDRKYSEVEIWYHPYWDPTGQEEGGSSAPPWSNVNTADGRFTRGAEFGDWRAYSGATDSYNYAPANYTQTPNERWGISAFADTELGNLGILGDVTISAEAFYTQRRSQRLIAPEPLAPLIFFGSPAPIPADNYYNVMYGPKDALGNSYEIADWRRRMVETGGRDQQHKAQTYQASITLAGEFSDSWSWDFTALYGENTGSVIDLGYFNLDRVAEAVGPTYVDAQGVPQCGTDAANQIAGCVPLNPFGIPGTDSQITQEMLQFISGNYVTLTEGGNTLKSAAANVTGELMDLPGGPLGMAVGVEKRWVSGFSQPDSLALLGTSTAGASLATGGSYAVDEAYVELAIPVIDMIDVSLAARYSDYSTYGSTTTTKAGVRVTVMDGLVLRGTISEAFRAPSIPELYGGVADTYPQVNDPCASDATASCVADGVPAGGYDNSGLVQLRSAVGGNPALQPEEADIYTVGLVWQPEFLDGSSVTLDYWDTDIVDTISTNGPQVILDNCQLSGLDCDLIDRMGPTEDLPGHVTMIWDLNTNVGRVEASGIDLAIVAPLPETDFGSFTVMLDVAKYLNYEKTLSNGAVVDHTGRLEDNQDGSFPEYKTNLKVLWSMGNFDASYTLRYIDDVTETLQGWWSLDPVTFEPSNEQHTIDSMTTHDIQVSYLIEGMNTRLTFGIDNVLDEQPPFSDSAFNDNTDVRTYPTQGRYFYGRVNFAL